MPTVKKKASAKSTVKKKTPTKVTRKTATPRRVVRKPVAVQTPKKRSMVGPMTAFVNFWRKYFDFVGRSTRSEFWFGFLFAFIVNFCFAKFIGGTTSLIVSAILFIPVMSLSIRRFRDAGISVWLYLIPVLCVYLIPIIRGSAWHTMMAFGYVSSGMAIYSLFFVIDTIFNIVVACLPTKK